VDYGSGAAVGGASNTAGTQGRLVITY
jgi:hypothetical protein